MKLMRPEKMIRMLNLIGCKVFVEDGCICTQGGNLHNLPNSHPYWMLIKIHYKSLCEYFGVKE